MTNVWLAAVKTHVFPATIQARTMELQRHDTSVSIEFGHGLRVLKFKRS